MKKFTTLLIGCSLALAGAALAQEPDAAASPINKKQQRAEHRAEKRAEANVKPGANAPQAAPNAEPQANAQKQNKPQSRAAQAPAAETNPAAPDQTAATTGAAPAPQKGQQKRGKGMKGNANATAPAAPNAATAQAPEPAPQQSAAPAANRQAGGKRKPDVQKVQQIKTQYATFRAKPRPDRVKTVTFQQNYRIQGAERWQGPQYEVYRSYHPERHDRSWYQSRYQRVELIAGGYYYWNNGYWFPAWGYSPQAEYYAYDAPIYVGHRAEPPDKVIADVQAVLKDMGYYRGEVDGLLGPLTREALTAYQSQQGLVATAVIDQPTLDSLGV